jgi:hypothetical protein
MHGAGKSEPGLMVDPEWERCFRRDYCCTECGNEITTGSVKSLPPCPQCSNNSWEAVTGGDAAADPYPDR